MVMILICPSCNERVKVSHVIVDCRSNLITCHDHIKKKVQFLVRITIVVRVSFRESGL